MGIDLNNDNISSDVFLSEHLGKETFRISIQDSLDESTRATIRDLQGQDAFLYSKVSTENVAAMTQLAGLKFQLVDTLITLEKDILIEEDVSLRNTIRLANAADEEQTVAIARSNFEYSRFHADTHVDNTFADRIKAEWVRNFFKGLRGNDMVLGVVDDRIAGFVQLLRSQHVLIIDLIAVDQSARQRKLATDMINYAQKYCRGNCVKYQVGTQLANTPSLNLYQNMGFRIIQKSYVYHYHS